VKINEQVPEQICPECKGKGELRRFKIYVGCYSIGCWKCKGKGTIPISTEGVVPPSLV